MNRYLLLGLLVAAASLVVPVAAVATVGSMPILLVYPYARTSGTYMEGEKSSIASIGEIIYSFSTLSDKAVEASYYKSKNQVFTHNPSKPSLVYYPTRIKSHTPLAPETPGAEEAPPALPTRDAAVGLQMKVLNRIQPTLCLVQPISLVWFSSTPWLENQGKVRRIDMGFP